MVYPSSFTNISTVKSVTAKCKKMEKDMLILKSSSLFENSKMSASVNR